MVHFLSGLQIKLLLSKDMSSMAQQQHVVFVNIASAGHMNPTLPVVAELRRQAAMPQSSMRLRFKSSSLSFVLECA